MPRSTLNALREAAETLRRLEAQALERGSTARAEQLDRLARDYEVEIERRAAQLAADERHTAKH